MARKKKPVKPRIISLNERRKQDENRKLRIDSSLDSRVADLEVDMLRAIDMLIDLQKQVESQHNTIFKLLRLLKEEKQ